MNGISFARVKQATNSDAFTPRTAPPMHQTVSTPAPAPLTVKQRRARRKKQIIYGSIALVVLWIVGSIIWGKREKPIPVTTETAIRKTIVQTVSATGKIQPEVEVKISPEVAGEIIELPVEDGMPVKKGDLLVKIKPDSYKALLEQQEAAISAAKATNLQQKATMMKTEQDLQAGRRLVRQKTDFRAGIQRGGSSPRRGKEHLRKFAARNRARRKPARVRRAINCRRRRFTHPLTARSQFSTANWANVL